MESFILPAMQLPWPTTWATLFGKDAPLLVEIGFGSGDFLIDLAHKRPSCHILGIEISLPSLRKGDKKVRQAQLNHVRLLQGSAPFILQAICPLQSIDELYINFPDPWPKATHQQRRLINTSFLHLAATRLKPNALLEIGTDHADYADAITTSLAQTPYFESRLPTPFITKDAQRYRTKYEAKGLAEGRICHYYKWQRNHVPALNQFPVPKEWPMPHVILQSPLTLTAVAQQFQANTITTDAIHIKYLALFTDSQGGRLLIETYINEDPIKQRLGLTIRQRDEGDWVVGLHEIGFPRPTYGVQLALYHLAHWLQQLHPDTVIHKSNLPFTDLQQPPTNK